MAFGWEKEDHKYVARVELPRITKKRRYRYFYSMAEYRAYLKRTKAKNDKNGLLSKLGTMFNKNASKPSMTTSRFSNLFTKKTSVQAKPSVQKQTTTTSKSTSFSSKITNLFSKTVSEVKTSAQNLTSKTSNGTKSVEKFVESIASKKVVELTTSKTKNETSSKIGKLLTDAASKVKSSTQKLTSAIEKGAESANKVVGKHRNKNVDIITRSTSNLIKSVSRVLFGAIGKCLTSTAIDVYNSWARSQNQFDSFSDVPTKSSTYTKEEDQAAVNPNYDTGEWEYTNNCSYCTAAYDMRQRGYDVEAAPMDEDHLTTRDEIVSWYDGAEIVQLSDILEKNGYENDSSDKERNAELLENEIKKYGDGARGHLCLYWEYGGGHDVIWEVENGEVVIRDCQTNKTYDMLYYVQYSYNVSYFRTDNIEPNEDVLKVVQVREEE